MLFAYVKVHQSRRSYPDWNGRFHPECRNLRAGFQPHVWLHAARVILISLNVCENWLQIVVINVIVSSSRWGNVYVALA